MTRATTLIDELEGGRAGRQLDTLLASALESLLDPGVRSTDLNIKLTLKKDTLGHIQIAVASSVKINVTKERAKAARVFVGEDGRITTADPDQPELPMEEPTTV